MYPGMHLEAFKNQISGSIPHEYIINFLQRYFKIEGVHNSRLANLQSLHFYNAIEYPKYIYFGTITLLYVQFTYK